MQKKANPQAPAVYVGTYAKYNAGNLYGEWVRLTDFDSYSDFISYIRKLHYDEREPEFMFQDFENIPEKYYNESDLCEDAFNEIVIAATLIEEYGIDAVTDFCNETDGDISEFEDYLVGEAASPKDFVIGFYSDSIERRFGDMAYYFDYDLLARDLFITDYIFSAHGYVFRRQV